MENIRTIKRGKITALIALILLSAFLICLSNFSLAYKKATHSALTQETFLEYNKLFGLTFDSDDITNAMRGSEDEDESTRPLQHFYDPVNNRGLAMFGKEFMSAKDWAQDTEFQAKQSKNPTDDEKYFENNTDFSWERAIFEYVHGSKERAMKTLGHILHLTQDMTVPAHVRNDDHLEILGYGDQELFENFLLTKDVPETKDLNIPIFKDLSEIFDESSELTNGNFLSKDTVFENYENPNEDFVTNWESITLGNEPRLFGIGKYGKLVSVESELNFFGDKIGEMYVLSDPKNLVLTDYWNILSKEAIENGIGMINLFFEEVEKEKKTGELLAKNKSRAELRAEKFRFEGFNIVKGLYGSSVGNEDLADLLGEDQTGLVAGALNDGNNENSGENDQNQGENSENGENVDNSGENLGDNSEGESDGRETAQQGDNTEQSSKENENPNATSSDETAENQQNSDESEENSTTTQQTGYQPGFGGGGGSAPTQSSQNQQNSTVDSPSPPTILTPLNYSKHTSTTISFTGNASSTNIISTDFSNAITTVDSNEDWILNLSNFNQGTTTVNFFASNLEQTATSTATTTEIFVDSTAPDISLTVDECQNSISQTGCLFATTTITIHPSWFSTATDINHYILNKNGTATTTTATSTQITISGNQSYVLGISAVDSVGNVSPEKTQIIQINNAPVVINEVAWAGTHSSSADEWIELYNNTNKDIDLTNWTLYAEDNTPNIPLSGTISANEYFLLERTDDNTVASTTVNLIYGNDGSSWALNNSNGEHLILAMFDGGATTTIDEISKVNKWNFKGYASPRYYSMERFSPEESGTDWSNWESNTGDYIKNGKTADGGIIYGTPKAKNNFSYRIAKGNSISSNKTLTKSKSPYLVTEDFTVNNGVTLSIESGVVIKFHSKNTPTLKIEGNILSNGIVGEQVVFTSFADDEFGGDLNNDGICDPGNASSTSACPSVGDWKQILIEPSVSSSVFEQTVFRYGGYYVSGQLPKYKGMVTVDTTDTTFNNSVFEYSKSKGLQLLGTGAGTTVSNSIFRNNNYEHLTLADYPFGMWLENSSSVVENNLFENNIYGMYLQGSSAVITSNEFKNNSGFVISSYGTNVFSNNFGNNNGKNGISLYSNLTNPNTTNNLKYNQLPYVIDGNISVVASSTLIVDPSVVVKFNDKKIDVYGRLEINGGVGSEVLFTSIADDSDGTNVGNDVQPNPLSPSNVSGTYMKSGATSIIKNAEFRYMKCGVSYENAPPIHLENVIFKNNKTAICNDTQSTTASSTVSNVTFENNTSTSTNPLP